MGPFPITFGRRFFGRVVLLDLLSACNLGGCGRRGRGRSEKGKGRGSAARPFRAQLVQRFGKNSARKPRYPTTGASFLRSIAGCFSVAGRFPGQRTAQFEGDPRLVASPWGYLGFRAKICLGGCTISDSRAIPIRKSNLSFRAFAFPVYYRKRPLMAIARQFFVCLAISMLPRVSR